MGQDRESSLRGQYTAERMPDYCKARNKTTAERKTNIYIYERTLALWCWQCITLTQTGDKIEVLDLIGLSERELHLMEAFYPCCHVYTTALGRHISQCYDTQGEEKYI